MVDSANQASSLIPRGVGTISLPNCSCSSDNCECVVEPEDSFDPGNGGVCGVCSTQTGTGALSLTPCAAASSASYPGLTGLDVV